MPTRTKVVIARSPDEAARDGRAKAPAGYRVETVRHLGVSSRPKAGQSRNIEWHRFQVVYEPDHGAHGPYYEGRAIRLQGGRRIRLRP